MSLEALQELRPVIFGSQHRDCRGAAVRVEAAWLRGQETRWWSHGLIKFPDP